MSVADVDDVLLRLDEFRASYGHLYVPEGWRCRDGFPLGGWVVRRRREYRDGCLHQRYEVLERLPGWDWQPRHHRLIEGLQRLQAYVAVHETAHVPWKYECEDGFKLGTWVRNRRRLAGKQPWLDEQLAGMPGWRWAKRPCVRRKRRPTKKERGLNAMWVFVCEHGHALPRYSYVTRDDDFRLGRWVNRLRRQRGKDPVMDALLESLPGWSWDTYEQAFDRWLMRFEAAREAGTLQGDLSLRSWARRQKSAAAADSLSITRRARLEKAGVLGVAPARLPYGKEVH